MQFSRILVLAQGLVRPKGGIPVRKRRTRSLGRCAGRRDLNRRRDVVLGVDVAHRELDLEVPECDRATRRMESKAAAHKVIRLPPLPHDVLQIPAPEHRGAIAPGVFAGLDGVVVAKVEAGGLAAFLDVLVHLLAEGLEVLDPLVLDRVRQATEEVVAVAHALGQALVDLLVDGALMD